MTIPLLSELLIVLSIIQHKAWSLPLMKREGDGYIDDGESAITLIIVLSITVCSIMLGLLAVLLCALLRFALKKKYLALENTIPGSLDDEFEIEERLSELSPNEQNLYRSGQDFIKQYPPVNEELSLSTHLLIQEKGIEAWDFIPDPNLPNEAIFINNKTEVNFTNYDYQCSIQTNLPIPKLNDVYYFEAKIFSLEDPEHTTLSIGLSTKPYPYFRLPGRHHYSISYDSDGSRRFNNSFKLNEKESNVFPELQQGDVIGIGYRCRSGTIFFTRNGKKLSEKSIGGHIKGFRMNNIFPIIGSNNPCSIHVNLGQYGYVFIEANIKKWGYALKEGTRPPLPEYNSSNNDLLIESSNEDDDEIIAPPDFYSNAGYQSSIGSKKSFNDNITLNSLPPNPPTYESDDQEEDEQLIANTSNNQFLGVDEVEDYEARNRNSFEVTPDEEES
ncbi:hypothetical protein BN7_142 [Wickerhamomyces ciferrii]|uniref:B30.2/SPRY domain-containing protein n=1 Tax=Wickerhamomyces ciferrii (strain ATCC 14091 / BCRC 22168 / CBS 111 / JCM 3599 / NBRC 0793 / NRRL Y-1031 F-60-10) TaxID=1206466 RepID=K0KGS2_WICCF|nr:uncharacterized protein BN7_142 [Wickerhamomyces ciferrii]CCH40609.1 hypothetical protein BN7_142 [Wickerhamomyces ciferrii]